MIIGCLEAHYQYSTWCLLLGEEKIVQVNRIRMRIFVLEAEISKLQFILLVLQSTELLSSAYALKYLAIYHFSNNCPVSFTYGIIKN